MYILKPGRLDRVPRLEVAVVPVLQPTLRIYQLIIN